MHAVSAVVQIHILQNIYKQGNFLKETQNYKCVTVIDTFNVNCNVFGKSARRLMKFDVAWNFLAAISVTAVTVFSIKTVWT